MPRFEGIPFSEWVVATDHVGQSSLTDEVKCDLSRMSVDQMLETALRSYTHYVAVCMFLTMLPAAMVTNVNYTVYDANLFNRLPVETIACIFPLVPMKDRIQLAMTCRHNHNVAAIALQQLAVEMLLPYRLSFRDLRFLQTATATVISGSTITCMFHAGPIFTPNDLDLFCKCGDGYRVVRFLDLSASYSVESKTDTYNEARGIRQVWTLMNGSSKINVIESLSSNPRDVIPFFHSTAVMGCWALDGIWHVYPKTALDGIALMTPAHFPVRTLAQQMIAWPILQKYTQRGYRFSPHPAHSHLCGDSPSCPATFRTSMDRGCLFMHFPTLPAIAIGNEFYCAPEHDMCWSFGALRCHTGSLVPRARRLIPHTHHQDREWLLDFNSLIASPHPPVDENE
ncbi:hypothetical protein B0H10DRAFT_1969068 [Mycena sp. CBHHK59/15]|nr:hypothetical protein B0H10DRAFT_1969068 [Mycena sp. CBHHK59/15]